MQVLGLSEETLTYKQFVNVVKCRLMEWNNEFSQYLEYLSLTA